MRTFSESLAGIGRLGRRFALLISLVVALAPPVAFGLSRAVLEYGHHEMLARLAAARLSRFVVTAGPLWTVQTPRMGDELRFLDDLDGRYEVRVTDGAGIDLFSQGDPPPLLGMSFRAPIVVRGETVAHVSVSETSNGALILAVVALASALLGWLTYYIAHRRPLRTIDLLLDQLRRSHRDVWQQSIQLTSASLNLDLMYREAEQKAEELRDALQKAELSSRAKSEFLAAISHELRTPLNAIIGFSEVIKGEMFGPLGNDRYGAYVQDIHSSGSHLLTAINDILDMVKLAEGRYHLNLDDLPTERLLRQCVEAMRAAADKGNVELLLEDRDGDLPTVKADPAKVQRVVHNLLSNAIKFTPKGGRVTVSVRSSAVGRGIEIAVADSGIGMTPAEMELAQQPFRQVDASLARRYEGAGIGLPLAIGLVKLHGGSLTLTSSPGQGTKAVVFLPAAAEVAGGQVAAAA